MIQEYTREMNAQERAVLEEIIDGSVSPTIKNYLKPVTYWTIVMILSMALAIGLVILAAEKLSGALMVFVMLCPGLLLVVGVFSLFMVINLVGSYFRELCLYRQFKRDRIPAVQKALSENKVYVKGVRASSVIVVEAFDDEGDGFVFDLENGRILFLQGDQYYPARDDMSWPNSDFEIVQSLDGNVWIGVFCYGAALIPDRVIKNGPFKEEVLLNDHEDIVEASMGDFVKSILTIS
jgi:hypothetical protein